MLVSHDDSLNRVESSGPPEWVPTHDPHLVSGDRYHLATTALHILANYSIQLMDIRTIN